ncbi:MAG TPA: hypothetical protein VG713_19115 [Pirellulales bacterium]|nr:hypothetical protein [Pirellulales bacterium]
MSAEASIGGAFAARSTSGSPTWATWELNEQLRHVERVLAMGTAQDVESQKRRWRRVDPAQPWNASRTASIDAAKPSPIRRAASALAWVATAIGLIGLTFGAVLVGWGWTQDRAGLLDLGIPALVVGQGVLMAGLLLHCLMLAAERRTIANPIESFDERVERIKHRLDER